MWFFRSPSIVFGEDSLSYLETVPFERILVVTDRNIENAGILKMVLSHFPETSEHALIADIPEEPTTDDIKVKLPRVGEFSPDLIIGLGGGSCMDAAKALFALYERPDLDIYDITPLQTLNLRKKARLILIPTTSGTGSECTWASVLSDKDHGRKNELASPEIIADFAILDPGIVENLPETVSRNTGVDAITHAIEAYGSQWKNYYSDIFAEKAISLITTGLPEIINGKGTLHAREQVHVGASMAGLAFSNSQIGLAHAMGHSLGAHFRIAHGISVGLYLPGVVSFNQPEASERYATLNKLFPAEYRKENLAETLRKFFKEIGQPTNIRDSGIDSRKYADQMDSLVSLAEESTGLVTNARDADSRDIRAIFEEVM